MSMVRKAALVALAASLVVLSFAGAAVAQTTTSTGGGLDMGVVFVMGAVFAVACGFVAKNKNRSVVLWAILGFLFGFVPLIIIAVLKKKQPAITEGMGGMGATLPPPPPPMP